MALITIREALRQAIDEEMERDDKVFLMGEEVAQYNGAYKVSKGLWNKYGSRRVIDTPITEEGFTGIGIGAAMAGLRPIVEWMTFNFSLQAIDQVVNNAAKYRYMSGGQIKVPIVFRGPNGPAEYLAAQHSQALHSFYASVPGLKVVTFSNPSDAKGLLKASIRDDNPVIFIEAELIYSWQGDVPEGEYIVPLGKVNVIREGQDITLVGFSKPIKEILKVSNLMEKEGVSCEVLDLRTLRPLDEDTLYNSVKKTNRCVVVDEGWPMASFGSYIGWLVSKNCFDYLDAPVEVVCGKDVPMPYNHSLEIAAKPNRDRIIEAIKICMFEV